MVRNCHSEALRAVLILTCTGQRTGLARRYGSLSGLEPIRFSEATAPSILRQKSLQYLHIATHFFLVYPKHLLTENCAHPSPKEFLTDFGDARRRKVRTFQGERRKKTQKFIGEGLVGSSPLRLSKCGTWRRKILHRSTSRSFTSGLPRLLSPFGHITAFRTAIRPIKKRMTVEGRTSLSCAYRNGADGIFPHMVWLAHEGGNIQGVFGDFVHNIRPPFLFVCALCFLRL